MKVSLPFAIDRTSALSLIAQVSEGFRRAIESGVYRPGDILPNMEDISAAAGVSMMVTRAAIRRLAADGLVEPRRRTGILVLDTGRLHWRGHVLVVTSELSDNYLVATVAAKLRVALGKAGYLVTQTIVLRDADKGPTTRRSIWRCASRCRSSSRSLEPDGGRDVLVYLGTKEGKRKRLNEGT